jgi:hypothetical protein
MDNHSTLQSWESLDRSTLKKAGPDEYHGPCPITGEGKDRFWLKPAAELVGCRGCSGSGGKLVGAPFKEHLGALGMTFGAQDVIHEYFWLDYATGETVKQTRHFGAIKYRWPPGQKTGALVYLSDRYHRDTTRPLVWTEGAKAADAAASKLPADDFDVVGFVSATTIPNAATLAEFATGRSCIVWGDDDPQGVKGARWLVSALRLVAADVVTIDPERLGLTGGHGHDAAEWHPRDSPGEELRAACGTAKPEEASPALMDRSEQVRRWAEELTNEDIEGQSLILCRIAKSPEWAALVPFLRIAFVEGLKGRMVTSMAVAILGRFDDRTGAWRDPPGKVEDTSEPDVVSLATLLADPLEPTAVVARGLAFGGTLGFIRGPKASGKTTILAAAAARVSQGQPWAGQDTNAGTVLVVTDDDPRSWTLALRDFGADTERILMARARVVSKPGKLAALLAEHKPAWIIIDNLRTWCRSMQLDTDNSSAAADAIDPIAEAIRECDYPVACSILHNEARSKGVTNDPYAGRMRNSTVFEDAADWIVGCAHVDGSTETTITSGEKTRRGIPTETLTIDLSADGHGTPTTGSGGDDPFTVGEPVNPLDAKINGYLMANPDGVSQNAVLKAVGGRRPRLVSRLKVVGTLGPDNLWRCATQPGEEAKPSQSSVDLDDGTPPQEQVCPDAQTGGGENRDTGGCVPVSPANGNQGGTHHVPMSQPIRDTPSGHMSGTHLGTHLAVQNLDPLAGAKTTTAPTPRGGDRMEQSQRPMGIGMAFPEGSIPAPPGVEPEPGGKHDEKCPGGCSGTGAVNGKACDWDQIEEDRTRQPIEGAPTTHTSGIKKWDDATSTWVDTLPGGDVFMVEGGIVHLSERTTVTDGDPNIHWDMTWTDIELDREEMVDYQ